MSKILEKVQRDCDQVIAEAHAYADSGEMDRDIDASIAEMEANRSWFEKLLDKIIG